MVQQKMHRQHKPTIKPLFDMNHAQQVMKLFRTIEYNTPYRIDNEVEIQFINSGHMLGSAIVYLTIKEHDTTKRIAYTGDVGRLQSHILSSSLSSMRLSHLRVHLRRPSA